MKILVLGGTRFIGRALVRGLLDDGHEVTLVHTGHHNPFGDAVERLVADRNDADAMTSMDTVRMSVGGKLTTESV